MIAVVDEADTSTAVKGLVQAGESAWEIGRIAEGPGPVQFF
jgi:phosphoribosylaminoimidazole (AIR) synthetase